MGITLAVGGQQFDRFESIRVFRDLETMASEFNFVATITDPEEFPIKLGASCQVFVNGEQVIEGFIEVLNCITASDQHRITISGRDKTADVIDSSVFDNIEAKDNTLVNIIKLILSKNNITGIDVLDNVGNIKKFLKNEIISAAIGENVFDLIEKYCKARQVLATTDGKGNISLERASTQEIQNLLLSQLSPVSNNNNIKSIAFNLDNSNRFNKVVIKAQGNASGLPPGLNLGGDNLANINASATDNDIRSSRIAVFEGETSFTETTARDAANWHVNIKRARGITANLTVAGYSYDISDESNIWIPNRRVNIIDDFWGINAQMLTKSVEYILDPDSNGSITNIELTTRDAYTLAAQEDEVFKKNQKKGDDLLAALGL